MKADDSEKDSPQHHPKTSARAEREIPGAEETPAKPSILWFFVPIVLIAAGIFLAR